MESPDDYSHERHQVRRDESDEDDTHSIGMSEAVGLCSLSVAYHSAPLRSTHVVVDCRHNHCAHHHQPIRNGNVHLAVKLVAGVDHLDVWEVG